MLRQYNPQRFRYATLTAGNVSKHVHVGTVPAGEIVNLPDHGKCIVRAWHPREYTAARRDRFGRWTNTFMAGGHLATVERLRDRRAFKIADHHLLRAIGD